MWLLRNERIFASRFPVTSVYYDIPIKLFNVCVDGIIEVTLLLFEKKKKIIKYECFKSHSKYIIYTYTATTFLVTFIFVISINKELNHRDFLNLISSISTKKFLMRFHCLNRKLVNSVNGLRMIKNSTSARVNRYR